MDENKITALRLMRSCKLLDFRLLSARQNRKGYECTARMLT